MKSILTSVLLAITACAVSAQPGRAQEKSLADWEAYFDKFKKNLAPMVYKSGKNLAYTKADPKIHPEQTAFARQMELGIYMPVKDRVYVGMGYALASTTMVVGTDGVIIIDPGENDTSAAEIMKDLRKFSDKPVKAVIYTHRHPDHCFAIKGLGVTEKDVKEKKVEVIAHETFEQWLINDASVIGPILGMRSSLPSSLLPTGPLGRIHQGLGSTFVSGPTSTFMPTIKVGRTKDLTIAGVKMTVFHAYGDAPDEISIWFPDFKHVHGSETIQGETFPNLYSLRGTSYRDMVQWYKGVDNLLAYAKMADTYSGSHMRPWVGNAFIVDRITNYRDAIQFIHDQSIRYMNKGYTPEELVDAVAKKLPKHLADDHWLQPYYGTPEHSVRNVYIGYLGWYEGDPTALATPGYVEKAQLYLDALGGRDKVLKMARQAVDDGKYGWAMEILTHPIRVNKNDMDARKLKAEAMRKWGYQQKNMYWRGFALGGANELEGKIDYSKLFSWAPPDVVKALPAKNVVESLRVRLDAEKAAKADLTVGFEFTDIKEGCALHIRRGVAVFYDPMPAKFDAKLVTTKKVLNEILLGETTLAKGLTDGTVTIQGDPKVVQEFFGYLEPPSKEPIKLIIR